MFKEGVVSERLIGSPLSLSANLTNGNTFCDCLFASLGKKKPFSNNSLLLTLVQGTKVSEFANSVDLDEAAHNEPPHLDLHCLSSGL